MHNCYPTARTGESPIQAFGSEFGGRDDYTYRDWTHAAGYLDAPDLLPAGSMRNDNVDAVPSSRYVSR
jgi:hypothetical protein